MRDRDRDRDYYDRDYDRGYDRGGRDRDYDRRDRDYDRDYDRGYGRDRRDRDYDRSYRDEPPARRDHRDERDRSPERDSNIDPRTGGQTFICFFQGIISLASLGFMAYFALMVPLLFNVDNGKGVDLVAFSQIEASESLLLTQIQNIFADPEPLIALFAEFEFTIERISQILLLVSIAAVLVTIVLSAVIALLMFLGGMLSGRYFSLSGCVAAAFGSYIVLYLVVGILGEGSFVASLDSGVLLGMIAGGAGLAGGFFFNIFYSISHLAKFKSIFKIITALGICGGISLIIMYFPYYFGEPMFNPVTCLIAAIEGIMTAGETGKTIFDLLADPLYLAVLLFGLGGLLSAIFLGVATAKGGTSLSVVFGHSRKKEKNIVVIAIIMLVFVAMAIAPYIINAVVNEIPLTDFAQVFDDGTGAMPAFYFALGSVIFFVSSILNAFVCEKRKRKRY